MNRRALFFAVVMVLAIVLTLPLALPPGPEVELTLAIPQRIRSTPIYVALDRGYFRDEGIEPTLMVPETGKAALAAVLDGRADFATVAGLPIIDALRAGHTPAILAAIAYGDLYLGIVTAPSSGIDTPHALRGKRVAVTRGTSADAYLASIMRSYGLAREEVDVFDAGPADALALLRAGEVDAVATWEQWLDAIAAELGPGAHILRDNDGYFDYWYLVGRPRSGPPSDAELRMMRALKMSNAYVQAHPRDAAGIMERHVGGSHEEWLATFFDLQLDGSVVLALQAQARLTGDGGGLASLTAALRPGPLSAVSPGTVNLPP